MAWKKKKKLEVISEILVANSDCESGSEASDFEVSFEEQEKKDQQQQAASTQIKTQRVADYQPGDRLKEGTQIFILLLDHQKV